jgi:XTP/dITP diphosphohydrolase
VGLDQLPDVPKCQEEGDSFKSNACQKAIYYSQFSDCLTLADDSGLEVDALEGLPGVNSARFISESASDEERYREILGRMIEVTDSRRTARFVCFLVLALKNEVLAVFNGILEGTIAREPKGSHGFGYDPIFYVPELDKTVAELSTAEKEQISHRGQALRAMADYLRSNLLVSSERNTKIPAD